MHFEGNGSIGFRALLMCTFSQKRYERRFVPCGFKRKLMAKLVFDVPFGNDRVGFARTVVISWSPLAPV
jgi:hypothetical protein